MVTGNYGSAGIIAFVAGIGFWLCFRGLDAQEDALNQLGVKPTVSEASESVYPEDAKRGVA